MKEGFPQEDKNTIQEESYDHLPDHERMTHWVQTGDSKYVDPRMYQHMKESKPEFVDQIENSENDMSAYFYTEDGVFVDGEVHSKKEDQNSILYAESPTAILNKVLDKYSENNFDYDGVETGRMIDLLFASPDSIDLVLEEIDLTDFRGVRVINFLSHVLAEVKDLEKRGHRKAIHVMNRVADYGEFMRSVPDEQFKDNTNFFAGNYLKTWLTPPEKSHTDIHDLISQIDRDTWVFDGFENKFILNEKEAKDFLEKGLYADIEFFLGEHCESYEERLEKNNFTSEQTKDFLIMMQSDMRETIERGLHIKLKDLSLKEQKNLLEYSKRVTMKESQALKSAVQDFGILGIRTFLSLEQDASTGDDIIFLSENLDEDIAQQVFEKYSEIIDIADKTEAYLKDQLGSEEIDRESLAQVRENILVKGKDILKRSATKVREGKEKSDNSFQDQITADLQKVKEDGLLLTSSVRGLKNINLETLKNISFESQTSQDLTPEDLEAMREMYQENYQSTPELQSVLLQGFEDLLTKDSVTFQVFRDRGTVRGSYALDQVSEGVVDFKAFNIDSSYQGARLGEEMMLRGLDESAKENVIHGVCDGANFISAAYIERGFVAKEVSKITEDGPEHVLGIERDDRKNQSIETKKLTKDEVKIKAIEQGLSMQNDTQKFFVKDQMTEHDYELLTRDEGWVLTRSVSDRETGEVYLAYERGGES